MGHGQKKRKAGGGKAAASKKMQAAVESGKYMWPTGCVKKYLTVKKILSCYVFYFNIFK